MGIVLGTGDSDMCLDENKILSDILKEETNSTLAWMSEKILATIGIGGKKCLLSI
jgi:hypothetical protein